MEMLLLVTLVFDGDSWRFIKMAWGEVFFFVFFSLMTIFSSSLRLFFEEMKTFWEGIQQHEPKHQLSGPTPGHGENTTCICSCFVHSHLTMLSNHKKIVNFTVTTISLYKRALAFLCLLNNTTNQTPLKDHLTCVYLTSSVQNIQLCGWYVII